MQKDSIDIYLGTQVPDGGRTFTTEEVRQEILRHLTQSEIGFSLSEQVGGYLHADGSFIIEDSIRISLVDPPEDAVLTALVAHLKEYFHQEAVLLVKTRLDANYYRDGICL